MDAKHKGAWAELLATTWLLEQGYEVFNNASQHGPADLVALDTETGEVLLIDVKFKSPSTGRCGTKSYWYPTKRTPLQRGLGVRLLYVLPDQTITWDGPKEDS